MSRVVVIGGGYGGMASAARLAKLGHEVTLVEHATSLGGALEPVTQDGFTWDASATSMLLPAVARDLFRKSGRTLEAELGTELVALDVIREHRFVDDSVLRLPGGSRAAQLAAFDALHPGAGRQWVDHVASYTDVWETLRRHYLERPWTPDALPREVAAILDSRETLHKRLRRTFRDERLRMVAGHPFVADGHDLRNVPAWAGVSAYLEQRFDAWTVPGGMHVLAAALAKRLLTRGVRIVLDSEVRDLVVEAGRVRAVVTGMGPVDADVVVCAIDPRRLPAIARLVERTMPAIPPQVSFVGLDATGLPELPAEVVLHGEPTLVVRTGGTAPPGHAAWTLQGRGRLSEDIGVALARHGIDVRSHVVTRVDRSPRELVEAWHGSPLGVLWQGRGTVRRRLGPRTPVEGLYVAGAHGTPGSGLPYVGLSAALVAQCVGPA
ncbi:MAG: FAD-dependent oxidoreductase [Nocardioides sp.]|nr:FAD-dependent oxidoreductase [Nocardioides sp.]